ncbi:GNAT family N-acetyltransferase [Chroococcidiopsis sp.]|uniref:GNAT family N-acetyltransferase n=1 Tax=Chroococcidiopsis sp. TaxID=3088168 RepID=UPI000B71E827|nr:GNAT family N-acetyltransferase [cyanobacterium TDX16]
MESDVERRWDFLPIDKKYQRDSFDCGYPVLNEYLKKYARQNHLKGIAKTFVAVSTSGGLKFDGYYTISSSVIEYESVSNEFKRQIPAYPIPAVLIGKLAVDRAVQGQGVGRELLVNALFRAVRASQEIGIYAVRVDAIDLTAKAFYLKHEFIPFQDNERSLFLPIETILRGFD